MKKLLVLLMVLGLATSAQAALTLSLSASTVNVGDTVTATVNSDNQDFWTGNLVLSEDTYGWSDPLAADWSTGTEAGLGNIGAITYDASGYHAVIGILVSSNATINDVVAGNQFVIDITGVQLGTLYLSLQDPTSMEEIHVGGSALTLEVVPEPMTIALLGLGGLFLRRRK